ncbi:ATP-binding protein [Chryseobacterium sp. JUb7]|uniref:sensor histidine kinase n=1 Tax=Chryseobacterium sp. JUb7 TaxID=2940599 RepID=UPI002169182D|nr:ATP-binding protein [Chryseobacterium sp. JUb7]MCS3531632.1 signal transduction histidine kinase/ligand-binding sensor domain-containing protein [Chryseobacterium sp. JUb7]
MRKLLLLFSLLLISTVFGQQYSSVWFNTDNGMPQNSIKDIVKDKCGFIWICTDGGILRYDGQNLINYKNLKLTNFSFVNFLGNVKSDHIILNNSGQFQYLIIKGRKITITDKKSPLLKTVTERTIFKNKEYVVFIKNNSFTTVDNGFIKLQKGTYFFDGKNIIYRKNSGEEKIIPLDFKKENQKNFFRFGEYLFFRDVINKRILKFSEENISVFNSDNSLYNDPSSKIFWQDMNCQNFIINKGKIYISELQNGNLKTTPILELKNNDIDISMIYSLLYDKENNTMYIGTLNKGLNIVKVPSFVTPKVNPTLENRVQYSMLPFGYDKIINFQGRVYDKNSLVKDYHFNTVDEWCLVYDESNNILYSKDGKIYRRLSKYNYEKYDSVDIGKNNKARAIFEDKGFYLLKTEDGVQYYLKIYSNGSLQNLLGSFAFKSEISTSVFINKDEFLVGCDDKMYIISLSKKTIKKQNIPNLSLKSTIITKDGNIWILTRGKGLYLYKNGKFTQMPFDKDGYLSYPNNLMKDSKGYLWISSNNGLFKIPENTLLEYAKNNTTKVVYYRYTKEDGFNINEFNGAVNSFTQLDNGDFVVPSMDGYVFFDPLKIPSYYPKAENIYVERARSKGADYMYFKDTLNLENDFNQASVYIDIPYYSNSDNLYIEASLQNADVPAKWQRLKDREYIVRNLPPGEYTLDIRVLISPDGKFAYRKILISVPALYYQTLWFRILGSVLFLGIILLIIFLRTRILTTKNSQLKKIVHQKNDELKTTQDQLKNESEYQKNLIQTINHDITTPIKYLSVMSQKLSETDNPKLQKQYFDTIYRSSEELYKFTLNLKNYTELFNNESQIFQEGSYFVFELLEAKKRLFEEISSQNNTLIINNSPKNIKLNVNESIIAAIIHNLLDNAVKNTIGGEIILDAKEEGNFKRVSISDSGAGMGEELFQYYNNLISDLKNKPSSLKGQGLGLHLVIHLLKKIDGKIIFKDNIPKGTQVEIIIQNQN